LTTKTASTPTASNFGDCSTNPMERRFLDQRIGACEQGDTPQAFFERYWTRQLESLKDRLEADEQSK
jgi:hypothetical protein